METSEAALRGRRRHAILCVLGSSAAFALAAACVKAVSPAIPTWEIVFFRSIFALPILALMLGRGGDWAQLRTRRPFGHVLRTAFGLVGMYGAFYGYATLPLATVTALGFAMPLFLTVLAVPLLGERVGPRRLSAVVVGLVGVMVMIRPWSEGADVALGPAAVVLVSVLAWALAMISIRKMGEAGERNIAIVAWFSIGSAVVSGLAMLPHWVTPTPLQLAFLVGTGLVSGVAQLLMTEAYRVGEPTLVAPFEYAAILYTTLLGLLIWGEAPDGWDGLGIAILVASGLYIWHREVTLGVRR